MPGMIVAPEPLAVEAAAQVLMDGGNAVDAAVTAAFVEGVVNPMNCGIGGYALAVHADSPYEDFEAFIAAARAEPGALTVADAGLMTAPHVMLGLLERVADVRFTSVHFDGGAPAMAAKCQKQVKLM